MKIESSGVIFTGVCSIQTEKCVAKQPSPITAVWTSPGRMQIDVCRICLEEQIRAGEWEIQGARVTKRADIAVYSPDKKLQLVVEVKKKPNQELDSEWAQTVFRNLVVHSGIPLSPYFLLVIPNDYLYLWRNADKVNYERPPDYKIEGKDFLSSTAQNISSSPSTLGEHYYLELLVASWLEELMKSSFEAELSDDDWFYDSGLYESIKNGSVLMQEPIAA